MGKSLCSQVTHPHPLMNLPPRGPEEGFEGLFETILLLRKMERPAASLREYNNLGCSEYIFLYILLRGAMGYTVFGTASYMHQG